MNQEEVTSLQEAREIIAGKMKFDDSGFRGKGFTSRSIEVPWAAAHIKKGDVLLDIGLSLGSPDCIGMLLEAKEKLGVTLEAADIIKPEKVKTRYPQEWLASILEVPIMIGDVRTMQLPEERYDVVTCISTIEHIGYDAPSKTVEGSAFERARSEEEVNKARDKNVNRDVLNSFHRALKKGGRALITVPMGKGGPIILRDSLGLYCAEWEYDEKSWNELVEDGRFTVVEKLFFKKMPEGWTKVASPKELIDVSENMEATNFGLAMCVLEKK
jgi:SAM-dependent methyltransferase